MSRNSKIEISLVNRAGVRMCLFVDESSNNKSRVGCCRGGSGRILGSKWMEVAWALAAGEASLESLLQCLAWVAQAASSGALRPLRSLGGSQRQRCKAAKKITL